MKTFLWAALLLCTAASKAQDKTTSLKVIVLLPKNDTGGNATIQLLSLPDSTIINTQVYSKNGNRFTVHTFSQYLVSVTGIGTEPISKNISITNTPQTITLTLKRSTTNMQNVVVVSRKPLVKQEDDKTVVDATALSNSSTNAYEVLEKTPGIIVDQDGNVYLGSMQTATVFINGREMKLSASDLASLLKSLPAGSISKIEILRNPSAKFDAASSGGIVNIVLKKGVKLGSNGSANLGYFQGVYSTITGGVNINNSMGKVNTYFNYQYTNRKNYEALNSIRLIKTDTSQLTQNAYTTYPSANHYIGAGIDVGFTKKFSLAFDTRINTSESKSDALNTSNIIKTATAAEVGNNQSAIYNNSPSAYWSNSLTSKYKIDSVGSEWNNEIDYNYFSSNNTQDYTNTYFLPAKPTIQGNGKNSNDKNIFVAQTDLVYKKIKYFNLEAGFKITTSNSHNSALYFYQAGSLPRQLDSFQTNTFKYREIITAGYLQLSKTVWGFTLKPGLRLETTNIDGRQTIPKDTSLFIKRTDLFPYVYLRHKIFTLFKTDLMGSAIYRRSIRRPYYEILNPYPKYVDQYLYDVGNPKLQPQFTTNYEFNIMFQDFPVFAVGMNETKNIFSNVTYQDDVTRIAYRTYDNLGKNKELYFRMIAGIPPGGKYFFYLGAQYNDNSYDGLYQNLPFHYSRGSWLFFMYQELKVTPTLLFSTQGFMRTKAVQNFYELNTFGGLFVSVNKSVLKKKANIILSVNDLLQTNHVNFTLNQGNVNTSGSRVNDTRRIGITLRYNFGISKPKEKKEFGAAPSENGN